MVVSGSAPAAKKAQQPTLKSFFAKPKESGEDKKPTTEGPSSPGDQPSAPQEEQQQPAKPEAAALVHEQEQAAEAVAAEKRERRSKKGEDKKPAQPAAAAAAAETPAPAAMEVEAEPVPAEAEAPAASSGKGKAKEEGGNGGGKSRKRLRKVAAEEDSDEDDVLGEGSGKWGKASGSGSSGPAAKPQQQQPAVEKKADGNGSESKKAKPTAASSPAPAAKEEEEPTPMEVEEEKPKPSKAATATTKAAPVDEEDDEEEEEDGGEEEEEEEEEASTASASAAAASSSAGATTKSSSGSGSSGGKKSLLTMTSKGKGTGKSGGPAATTKAILAQLAELQPGTYVSLSYRTLTDVLDAVEAVSGRLEITDIVRALLAKTVECCPSDLPILMYLLCGKIYPAYKGVELGIGDKILFEALKTGLGASPKTLQQHMGDDGDMGVAAQKCKAAQRTLGFGRAPKPLTCKDVLDGFREIAACTGGKSQEKKVGIIRKLLLNCAKEGAEVKFLVRGLQTKLRCKLAEPTVLTALAQALVLQKHPAVAEAEAAKAAAAEAEAYEGPLAKEVKTLLAGNSGRQAKFEAAEVVVKQAYSECPNYDELVAALLSAPLPEVLKRCRLQPGVPVKPMLAKAQDSFQEVLKRMQGLHFTMEYKYDGERAQIHKLPSGEIKIFSRNSEDTTGKYPDVVSSLGRAIKEGTTSFVIDAEAVAIDPATGKLLPFQILSTRKRKAESEADIKVQVVLYAFDILYLNDGPVLQKPLIERRAFLREAFHVVPGKFDFAISMDHNEDGDTSPIEAFLDEAVQGNCEGLMIKTLEQNATYEPTKRSLNWLKLKKDYLTGVNGKGPADSLDLVVIGAYHGKGKRTGWYGAFLLACYDPEAEEYQSVCKIGTGFSEEFLAKVKPELDALVVPMKPSYYNTGIGDVEVWFEPKTVWEVRAADLSLSSAHKSALHKVESGKGIALRFPRFIRERLDKNPEDATNAEQVADAYRSQALVESNAKSGKDKGGGDDDDDDGWCI